MDRTEWLKNVRAQMEALYDHLAPAYWDRFGLYSNSTHLHFIDSFLQRLDPHSFILDAACGAGRYDGLLLEAGHRVLGIDHSGSMLERARQQFPQAHFPMLSYQQTSLQEMDFHDQFDGVICMDSLEHVFPEDYPGIVFRIQNSLRSSGWFYFTVEIVEQEEISRAYDRAIAQGLPVVYGELADMIDAAYHQLENIAWQDVPAELAGAAAYHYYPPEEQVLAWLDQAGFAIEEQGTGDGYAHMLVRKRS